MTWRRGGGGGGFLSVQSLGATVGSRSPPFPLSAASRAQVFRPCAGRGPRGGPPLGMTNELACSRGASFLLYWGTAGLPAALARLPQ